MTPGATHPIVELSLGRLRPGTRPGEQRFLLTDDDAAGVGEALRRLAENADFEAAVWSLIRLAFELDTRFASPEAADVLVRVAYDVARERRRSHDDGGELVERLGAIAERRGMAFRRFTGAERARPESEPTGTPARPWLKLRVDLDPKG